MDKFILCAAEAAAPQADAMDWELIFSTVVTGISIVFLILAVLILFLTIMGNIFKTIDKNKAKKAAEKAEAAAAAAVKSTAQPAAAEEIYDDEDDDEVIAVIAAAIAAYGDAEGKHYRITGVKRSKNQRSQWGAAGIADNMH